jgi:hypothetical protein
MQDCFIHKMFLKVYVLDVVTNFVLLRKSTGYIRMVKGQLFHANLKNKEL